MYTQSANEIMQKAIEVEKEGADFYRKLSVEAGAEGVKRVFLELMADEVRHQRDFAMLSDKMKGLSIESSVDILALIGWVTDELKETIKGSRLFNMHLVNYIQAIKIGMRNEEASIKAYSSLLEVVPVEFSPVLKKIIAEEQAHLLALQNIE
jgi:rubrerythrin